MKGNYQPHISLREGNLLFRARPVYIRYMGTGLPRNAGPWRRPAGIGRSLLLGILVWAGGGYANDIITTSWLPAAGAVGDSQVYFKLLEKFRETHPGVEVREFMLMTLPYQFADASTAMGVASAAGPDILSLPLSRLGDYIQEGLIQPVDDLYASYATPEREWTALHDALRIDGKVWTAAASVHVPVLVISQEACAKAGIKESELPTNWDKLASMAARLTTKEMAGLGLPRGTLLMGLWTAMVRQAGEDPGGREGRDGHREYALTAPGAVQATGKLQALATAIQSAGGRIRFEDYSSQLEAAMGKGEIAMALMDSAVLFVPVDPEEDLGYQPIRGSAPYMIPFPGAFEAAPLVWATQVTAWVMPSYIKNQARRKLLWEYMTTVSTLNPSYDGLSFANLSSPGAVPDLGAVVRHPERSVGEAFLPSWLKTFKLLLPMARLQPPYAEHWRLAQWLLPGLEELMMKGGSPQDVLTAAQSKYDASVRNVDRLQSSRWRAAAYAGLALLALALLASLGYLVLQLIGEIRLVRRQPSAGLSRRAVGMLLLLFVPGLLLSMLFAAYPLLNGLDVSLFSRVLNHGGIFVGLNNYVNIMLDPGAQRAVAVTLGYLAWSFLLGFIGPLVLAIVLSGFIRLQMIARLMFFIPAAANAVVIALLWRQLYTQSGAINMIAGWLGFAPQDWLGSQKTALFSVCLAQAWAGLGINGLVYLAGLSTIPESLFEDAEMAGAGLIGRWEIILWPHLKPLIGVSFVGWLLATARTSEHVLLLTAGGPEGSTHVLGLDIFKRAYVDIHYGAAMAEVWVLVSLILVLAIYQMRAIREGQLKVTV